jgi:hypothetical protein
MIAVARLGWTRNTGAWCRRWHLPCMLMRTFLRDRSRGLPIDQQSKKTHQILVGMS